MTAEKIKINSLVPPTWNRLKVNDTTVELPIGTGSGLTDQGLDTGKAEPCDWKIETGCGTELSAFLEKNGTAPELVANDGDKLVSIKKTYTESAADILCFVAKEGQTVNILTDVTSDEKTEGTAVLQVLLKAEKGAKINLAQIVRPGKGLKVVNDIGSVAAEGAQINIVQVFSDGSDISAGCRTALEGEEAASENHIGLVRTNGQTLDMNYVMKHLAKCTRAEINVTGALSKKAQKTFRGTIDFVKGCTGSDGAESENMLLLDDTIVNKTVPLILCTEESVAGSHGATIGKPAEDILFYMMSRGITRERAIDILERASLEAAANKIENAEAREYVLGIIAGKYADE
ncbi:MAG: SufD family Fe-S cluster assembly protein [Lachnospiraceae bacterium]|nr:SufD family Fe-S cluster assembly protein [Lachnospiraceae bacterium]